MIPEPPSVAVDALRVSVERYTVVLDGDGRLYALRNGDPWRELAGDKLVLSLAQEIRDLREELHKTSEQLDTAKAELRSAVRGSFDPHDD